MCVNVKWKSYSYASRQLKVHEHDYPTYDLELGAVVFEFKISCQYLYRVYIDVFTDQKSLQYVFIQKVLSLKKRRWLDLYNDNNISVHYSLYKANVMANTLSKVSMRRVAHTEDGKRSWKGKFIGWIYRGLD